jgi:hypothetical protein
LKGDQCHATYSVSCIEGNAAVVKNSTCDDKTEVRKFNVFHWWRDTEIKKSDTKIEFADTVGLGSITSGKVSFDPSGNSCEEVQNDMMFYASMVTDMIRQDRVRKFVKVSNAFQGYAAKKRALQAMGCPTKMLDVSNEGITKAMEEYFTKNSGGRDQPMADIRFQAALQKIKSTPRPTRQDFLEVVAVMKYGTCPEATAPRAAASAELMLSADVNEANEAELQKDVQTCFADEDCSALEAKFPSSSSLLQLDDGAFMNAFLANFLLFLAVFVLCIVFWPFVWIFLIVWLLSAIILTPFQLLSGPTVVYENVHYHLGSFDYLVDDFCRPAIAPIGLPLRRLSGTVIRPAHLAPPVEGYVTYNGVALVDLSTGWPIAKMNDGQMKPLIGLPRPA